MDSPIEARQAFGERYRPTPQVLHWLTAVLMFTLAWVMVSMKENAVT